MSGMNPSWSTELGEGSTAPAVILPWRGNCPIAQLLLPRMERFGGFMAWGVWGGSSRPHWGPWRCSLSQHSLIPPGRRQLETWKALMSLQVSVFCKKCGKKLSLKFNPAWNAQGMEEQSKMRFISGELRLHMKEPCKYLPC